MKFKILSATRFLVQNPYESFDLALSKVVCRADPDLVERFRKQPPSEPVETIWMTLLAVQSFFFSMEELMEVLASLEGLRPVAVVEMIQLISQHRAANEHLFRATQLLACGSLIREDKILVPVIRTPEEGRPRLDVLRTVWSDARHGRASVVPVVYV